MSDSHKKKKLRVIIVDDSPDIVSRLSRQVSTVQDLEVLEPAMTGRDAIDLFRDSTPDIAFIDMQLPDINGIEIVKKVREFNKDAQIIILTVLESGEYESSCLEAGANFFLNKFQDFERIPDILQTLVDPES